MPKEIGRPRIAGVRHNLAAATLGNIIGGAMLVGLVYWYIYLRDDRETK